MGFFNTFTSELIFALVLTIAQADYNDDNAETAVILSVGAIVGIAIGAVVLFILCCVCILRCCCGCCQRRETYVQTTVLTPQPVAHTFVNIAQPAYPTAPAVNQPYPYIPSPFQQQASYEPLVSEAPPQYFPKQ